MKSTAAFTIVEVLVAITISLIALSAVSTLLLSSVRSDGSSRARTNTSSVAENWLERYRAGQEPLQASGTICTGTATTFTCTYPKGHDYGADGVTSHALSSATMNARFQAYQNVITGTRLQSGTNNSLWQLTVRVQDTVRNQTMEAATYVLQ